ncbi:SH3 domain of the SH3b1 type [Legionella massiliensis]|uniref:SH3 domain of the SH3b1 type n=1 Tax=Legionella massiliensis TaxID=1034943 RepID=A0A078L4Q9_9GAMM|nr:SH3 domain-containing C40 family peptidase [Legionella massiliensis]CDZ79059.1 SH3 domain of the SH3b1 type [Legionella massiliensis]CEE14797.1 SH3 domain of the SH3b1 type [Legionella massiliensis]
MILKDFLLITSLSVLATCSSWATEVPIEDFSLKPYSQNVNDYLSTKADDYSTSLVTEAYQKQQLARFYNHYYASDSQGLSPWSQEMVRATLPLVKRIELAQLESFSNQNKAPLDRHYSENFKEQSQSWWNKIKQNMNLSSLDTNYYQEANRAIAIRNTHARTLPDEAPDFFHFSLPGQGYPFDNLQDSSVWVGTPLYVITTSQDRAWSLVLTPDSYFSWVKSSDIAYASGDFVNQWQHAAQQKLVAITKTETIISNTQENFQFKAYIGAVFPLAQRNDAQTKILIPVKDRHNQAAIRTALVSVSDSELMPLQASPKNLARILRELQNRPYGWGGLYFFNDCSQEMKSLFAPFAIWLPRNSGAQGNLNSALDLTKEGLDERLATLKEKGHPLMTLIYLGGHVMLYLGNKTIDNQQEAISYQNVWGLSPQNRDKRYVIGQSAFLPILKYFPENPDINSQGNARYFRLIYLDQLDSSTESAKTIAKQFLVRTKQTP